MLDLRNRAVQGAVKVFHIVRMVIVACVCLLIGVSARHLFDAYGPEVIASLKKQRIEAEVLEIPAPQQDLSLRMEPVDPRWN